MTDYTNRMRETWANLPLGIRVILALLALGVIAVPCGRPLRSALRFLALERNSRLAEDAIAAGDAQEARSRGRAAIQSAPERIEVARTVLQSMDILNDPKRIQVATILMQHPDANSADRALALEVLASHAPMVIVGAAWAGLSKEEKAMPEMIDAFARRLMWEGKSEAAALLLKDVDFPNPPDSINQLLVDLLQDHGSPDAWVESQKLLSKRTRAASDASEPLPDWCLADWERVPQEHLDSQALAAFPKAGSPRVMMLRRRIEQGGRSLDLRDPPIASWLRQVEPGDRLALASLLANCGHESTALELFEQGAGLMHNEYEWIRDIRIRTQAWRPWLDFLKSPAVLGISQAWVDADRALAYFQLNEIHESKNAWREAIQSAAISTQVPRLIDLCHRVRPWMPAHAEEALLAAIASPDQALPLFNDLQWLARSLEKAGNDKALLDLSRTYLGIEPGNPVVVTRYAYLALLAGELSPAAAIRMITPIIEDQPGSPHPRIVAVMAALLLDDISQAQRWIARETVNWEKTQPFYQWLIARAGGSINPPPDSDSPRLLPSESALIEKLLKHP